MDLSAVIFVALAVAWAVYLIPKALRHHEDGAASRSIDGFSDRMRVLARREAVNSRTATLVVPGRPPASTVRVRVEDQVEEEVEISVGLATELYSLSPAQYRAQRAAAALAARRRLRVVLLILAAIVGVATASGLGYVDRVYTAIPIGVLLAWLVACRLMVTKERSVRLPAARRRLSAEEAWVDTEPADGALGADGADGADVTEEIAVVMVSAPELPAVSEPTPPTPGGWDPAPAVLPTYVAKEAAPRRTVRTIDLDSTGVWSSGANAADSELAREHAESERAARAAASEAARRRAAGS